MTGLGIQTRGPPTSSKGAFQLPSSSSSNSDLDDDDAPLPFPTALPRSDFLAPDFQPATYLSNLPFRHQTLDDLKSDLRERSAAISAELLELVNSNYTSFLSLGDELRGGNDKVEDVKVAMLGFRRHVEEIKNSVRNKKDEVSGLTFELTNVRREVEDGRRMLELDERISILEERLAIASLPARSTKKDDDDWSIAASEDEDEEDEDEDGLAGSLGAGPAKLAAFTREYCAIRALADSIGQEKPFVVKTEARMAQCRNTLLLDLNTALKEAKRMGEKGKPRIMQYLTLYGYLQAESDALKTLRSS